MDDRRFEFCLRRDELCSESIENHSNVRFNLRFYTISMAFPESSIQFDASQTNEKNNEHLTRRYCILKRHIKHKGAQFVLTFTQSEFGFNVYPKWDKQRDGES